MIDDRVVDVGAACLGVAARCEDLEDSAAKVHQCNIVGSSSEAEDLDFHLLVRLVQAIGKACCGGLVDYPIHFEACDLTRILCCLPLVVVEVRGNSDDNLLYRSSEKCLSVPFDLLKYEGGNLLRSVFLSVDADLVVASHLPLDFLNRSLCVSGGLSLRDRKSTRLNSSPSQISYAVFCLQKQKEHHV